MGTERSIFSHVRPLTKSREKMEPLNFKWALPHVAILAEPDHPKMYKWLLDQQITKLYSVHKQVPKQIKGTPKLENEFHRKQQYQVLTCDELENYYEIIEDARLMGKKIAFHDDSGCNHAAMIIAGYLQKEHPVEPKAVLAMVNQIQPNSLQSKQQQDRLFEYYQYLNARGFSKHFFREDPACEYHSVSGRPKAREYEPHSMLLANGRYFPDAHYKLLEDKELFYGKPYLTAFPY